MSGSLQIKKNMYYAVLYIADENGDKKPKWISTKISAIGNHKREAEKELRRIITEYESKNVAYSKEIKFSDWLIKWLEIMKHRIEVNTYEGYESYINKHLKPYFDKKKVTLSTITPKHIQDYYTLKLKGGRCDGKEGGLSPNSIKRHSVVINSALEEALKLNMIPYNPAKRATLPKNIDKFKGKFYTEKQINQLLEIVKDTPIEAAVTLTVFYGLRRSEICGLKWDAIDFDNDTVTIKNTVVMTKTILEKERTKNKTSYRTLPLFEDVKKYLKQLKVKQAENRLLCGQDYNVNDFICKWDDGRPLLPSFISKKFKSILTENKMPVIRFHDLRHTTASLLISKGFSLKEIQEWLGHCNIGCTGDIYGHLEYKSKINMASKLNDTIKLENVINH